eukprot:g30418.t1
MQAFSAILARVQQKKLKLNSGVEWGVYFVDARRKAISLRDVCAQYLTELLGPAPVPSGSLNFMCFPGELESALKSTVDASPWHSTANGANGYATTPETKDVLLDGLQLPKDRCDSIVYADGLFWWSANVPRAIIPAKDNRSERFSKRRLALDVGASPGGWSYCLATQLCIQRTIACDPAAYMHPAVRRLVPEEEVRDERMRGADALDQLSSQKLSIFVCDMNDALEASCQLLYRIAREGLYEPPCLAVVTFKKLGCAAPGPGRIQSSTFQQERKRAMLAQIRADRILTDVQEIHLFANTRLETTIEIFSTSIAAIILAAIVTLLILLIYRRELGIVSVRRKHRGKYNFEERLKPPEQRLKSEHDEDDWLDALRELYGSHGAVDTKLASLDEKLYHLARGQSGSSKAHFHSTEAKIREELLQVGTQLPDPDTPSFKELERVTDSALKRWGCRTKALALLADRSFRKKSLLVKAQMIEEATGARLRVLPAKALSSLRELPRCSDEPSSVTYATALESMELARAREQEMDFELFFWIDYCCLSPTEAVAQRYYLRSGLVRKDRLLHFVPSKRHPTTRVVRSLLELQRHLQELGVRPTRLDRGPKEAVKYVLKKAQSSNASGIRFFTEEDAWQLPKFCEADAIVQIPTEPPWLALLGLVALLWTLHATPRRRWERRLCTAALLALSLQQLRNAWRARKCAGELLGGADVWVLQRNVTPYLHEGRKFHLRALLLCVGDPWTRGPGFDPLRATESKQNMSLDELGEVSSEIFQQLCEVLTRTLNNLRTTGRRHFFTLPNCWELFGVDAWLADFLVNSAREVLLLEVNPSPSLAMYRGSYGDLLGVESPLQEPLPSQWRRLPLMERLLAYCFCKGGLTPYALDAASFVNTDETERVHGTERCHRNCGPLSWTTFEAMLAWHAMKTTQAVARPLTSLARHGASRRAFAAPGWATVDPETMSAAQPAEGMNLCGGSWSKSKHSQETAWGLELPSGDQIEVPNTGLDEIEPFVQRMASVPRSGLHNPFKNPDRYVMLGEVCGAAAREMFKPEVSDYFCRLIQRVAPKSYAQAGGEIKAVRTWLQDYSGNSVRMLAESQGLPGDHPGQSTVGYRMPFGGVSVITPFNFPLEICSLQTLSAVFMGNQCTTKVDWKVAIVMEQFLRMLHACGLPKADVDYIYCDGPVFNEVLLRGDAKMTLFTGSQRVADKLAVELKGKDVMDVDFVAWQADHDAYGFAGQKNWTSAEVDIVGRLAKLAGQRSLENLTNCPKILDHMERCLSIPGATLAFGGQPLTASTIAMDKVAPVVGGLAGLWVAYKVIPVMYRWELIPGEWWARAKTINYHHYSNGIVYSQFDNGDPVREIPEASKGKMLLRQRRGGWKLQSEMEAAE